MTDDEDMIEAAAASKQASSGEVKLYAWLAILAACLFIAIIALQVIEFLHYGKHPSVWPATP